MNEVLTKRHYVVLDNREEFEDIVRDSSGREHLVTMRGWHWKNLDWAVRTTYVTEDMLVDNAIISLYEMQDGVLSKALEASIYYLIEGYEDALKGKKPDGESERMLKMYKGQA